MAAPPTASMFLELLRRSRLIDDDQLERYLRQHPYSSDRPAEAAAQFVRDNLLTRYQAQVLLSGRWKGFFLAAYKILKPLGRGGMSTVFLAEHTALHRKVAIKVLPASLAADPAALERFYREGRAAAALDHPNLVRAYDISQEAGVHFLVMEYVEGQDLAAVLEQRKQLSVNDAVACAIWAATGLQHAFSKGVIHRDVKPANLIVAKHGGLKILDMGLARFFLDEADDLTRRFHKQSLACTPDYTSPEQTVAGGLVDIRSDIYSLGCTFYALLTGNPPFVGAVTKILIAHQSEIALPVSLIRKEVPDGLAAVIATMMAKKPADRYQTPAEVIDALRPWAPEGIFTARPAGSSSSTGSTPSPFFVSEILAAEDVDTEPDDDNAAMTVQVEIVVVDPATAVPPAASEIASGRRRIFPNRRPWLIIAVAVLLLAALTIRIVVR